MRVTAKVEGTAVSFAFQPDPDEPLSHGKARMARMSATVRLPIATTIHPDLLALTGALIVAPFSARVDFDGPITPPLAEALETLFEKPFRGAGDPGRARPRPNVRRPGLAFSGGVDSLAAALLLPQAELFHLLRKRPKAATRRESRSTEGALASCAEMADRIVHVVPSNLEYVRDPIGFPDDLACAAPVILMADARGLDAVAFGTIGEAAYRYGVNRYRDFDDRPMARRIQAVFSAVGLPVLNPVAGLSEVMTTAVVAASPFRRVARSCQMGRLEACGVCRKCFRKAVTEAAISGEPISDERADTFFSSPSIVTMLLARPIKLENVLAWGLARYPGSHPLMTALKTRIESDGLDWMEGYDAEAIEEAPADYRPLLTASLDARLRPLTPADLESRAAWSARGRSRTDEGRLHYRRFLKALLRRDLVTRAEDGTWEATPARRRPAL